MASFIAVGSQYTFWAINNNGVAYGTTGAIANGGDAGMGRLEGISNGTLTIPPSRNINRPGDNANKGTIKIASDAVPEGELTTVIYDPDFNAVTKGLLVNTINGRDYVLNGVPCPSYASVSLVFNSPAQNTTPGDVGEPGWQVMIYHNVQVDGTGATAIQTGTGIDYAHGITASYANKTPYNRALTLVADGATSALQTGPIFSDYPMTQHTFIADGTEDEIVLNETPAAADATTVEVRRNGTLLAYTTDYTVTPATRTVTLVSPGTAADIVTIWYGFVPQC